MGLKIKLTVLVFIVLFFNKIAIAGWIGPTEALSGSWGSNPGQFAIQYGDTSDTFPTTIDISPTGRIAITEDQTLKRVQIFSSTGQLVNIINSFAYTIAFNANDNLYVSGGGFREYDSSGNIVWSKTGISYDALYALTTGNIIGYDKDNKNYSFFSPTGQLIKTLTTRPLELGQVTQYGVGGVYKIKVTYPDNVYQFTSTQPLARYYRDSNNYLYQIEKYVTTDKIVSYRVHKYTLCGKEISVLTLPLSQYEPMPDWAQDAPTWKPVPIMEYGEPLVSSAGAVYTWARTSTQYKILKWTWQDDPNVPTGPDAPTNLAVAASINGLYLTWAASPNDPGCVTGYELDQATTSGGPYTVLTTVNAGVLKYNDASATTGTTYYYKIRAVSGTDYSVYTSEVSGKR